MLTFLNGLKPKPKAKSAAVKAAKKALLAPVPKVAIKQLKKQMPVVKKAADRQRIIKKIEKVSPVTASKIQKESVVQARRQMNQRKPAPLPTRDLEEEETTAAQDNSADFAETELPGEENEEQEVTLEDEELGYFSMSGKKKKNKPAKKAAKKSTKTATKTEKKAAKTKAKAAKPKAVKKQTKADAKKIKAEAKKIKAKNKQPGAFKDTATALIKSGSDIIKQQLTKGQPTDAPGLPTESATGQQPAETKSNTGKYLAAGAAVLVVGYIATR